MKLIISRNFEKKLKKFNQSQDNWYDFFNELSKLTFHDIYNQKKYGVKKYKGNSDIPIYGIDFNIRSAERIIATVLGQYTKEKQEQFKVKTGLETVDVLILHDISEHDSQNDSVLNISKNDLNIDDLLPFISNSVQLNDLYSYLTGRKISKILSEDKNEIVRTFVTSNTAPTILQGIAGSGKTEVLKGILSEWNIHYPDSKILFLTSSMRLIEEIIREMNLNNPNIDITTLASLINNLNNQTRTPLSLPQFKAFLSNGSINDYNISNSIINISNKHGIKKVFAEITAVIFGKANPSINDVLSRNEYSNSINQSSIDLNEKEKEVIFNIAYLFIKYYEKSYMELSYECNKLLKKGTSTYDLVLVDEVQDYTEIQFMFIYSLVKNKQNIFISGDINQTINPTLFKFGNITKLLHHKGKNWIPAGPLISNYRNSSEVTQLINILNELRNEKLPTRKQIHSQNEHNMSHENGRIYLYYGDVNEDNPLFSNSKLNIIKSELSNFNPNISLTVHDIKGLEFEYVATIDIISDYCDLLDEIFEESYKKNESMHYFFNLFYVAISRVMKNLVIIESKPSKLLDYIRSKLNQAFILTEVTSLEKIDIEGEESLDNLFYNGIESIKTQHFQVARRNFSLIKNRFEKYPHVEDLLVFINMCEENQPYVNIADYCFTCGLYNLASIYYKQANKKIEQCIMVFLQDQNHELEILLETYQLDFIDLSYCGSLPAWISDLVELALEEQLDLVQLNFEDIDLKILSLKEVNNGR
ncbi:MAG: AAA family ATPase [Erysipelotrichia bacterium]|jgi:hypothetical protein|nr:AAA family ATPase [Erysipelotrichia bacterium]